MSRPVGEQDSAACGARLPDPVKSSHVHICSRTDDHSRSPEGQHWDFLTDMTWPVGSAASLTTENLRPPEWCPNGDDGQHCGHWWDDTGPCCRCGDDTDAGLSDASPGRKAGERG